MADIHIPFLPRFKAPMLADQKTMTCRTSRKGEIGDEFEVWGSTFILRDVYRIRLGIVADLNYSHEGCESPEEFQAVWRSLHPSGFDPAKLVWLHEFVRRGAAANYPEDWPEIARAVKERAGGKCERCGTPHNPAQGFTLTVNHMDMDPRNVSLDNLAALCQGCHLYVQSRGLSRSGWLGQRQARIEEAPHAH